MTENANTNPRSRIGYGSSYHRGGKPQNRLERLKRIQDWFKRTL